MNFKKPVHPSRFLLVTALLFGPAVASAAPFAIFDQGPLARIYGLPAPRDGTLTPAARAEADLRLDLTNNFVLDAAGGEALVLDGETFETTLAFRRGLRAGGRDLEVGFAIPWVRHSRGVLDSFIDDWHERFGLPDGGRSRAPSDRFLYRYSRAGQDQFRIDSSVAGIGDARLQAAVQLSGGRDVPAASALYASLSIPTGDEEELLGSGAYGFSTWVSGRRQRDFFDWPLSLHGSLGVALIEKDGVLAAMRNPLVGLASGGCGLRVTESVELGADINFHTGLYRASKLSSLRAAALSIAFGGSVRLGNSGRLELAIVEDLDNSTSPDLTLHAAFRWSL